MNRDFPLWKKLCSYLHVFPVEQIHSEINGELNISFFKNRYMLSTANAIYSFEDKYVNFLGSFRQLDWSKYKPENALVLGLGLASVVQILETECHQKIQYTCIEIDEQVAYLANKYVLKYLDSPVEIVIADAQIFVDISAQEFDMIIVDIFLDDIIPSFFESREFLVKLKNLISKNGLIVLNRLACTKQDKIKSKHYFKHTFHAVFPAAECRFVHSNYMLTNTADYYLP